MPDRLKKVTEQVIKAINTVKSRTLNTRLFMQFYDDFDGNSKQNKLLYFAPTRWLTRGRSLQRIYNLKGELKEFFAQQNRLV